MDLLHGLKNCLFCSDQLFYCEWSWSSPCTLSRSCVHGDCSVPVCVVRDEVSLQLVSLDMSNLRNNKNRSRMLVFGSSCVDVVFTISSFTLSAVMTKFSGQ